MKNSIQDITKKIKRSNRIAAIVLVLTFFVLTGLLFFSRTAFAGNGETTEAAAVGWPEAVKIAIGFVAAAMATGMSTFAAGKAVSMVGSAAMGAVAEKPEILGRSLIFVGLAEGIGIYGLIISIIILGKI